MVGPHGKKERREIKREGRKKEECDTAHGVERIERRREEESKKYKLKSIYLVQ